MSQSWPGCKDVFKNICPTILYQSTYAPNVMGRGLSAASRLQINDCRETVRGLLRHVNKETKVGGGGGGIFLFFLFFFFPPWPHCLSNGNSSPDIEAHAPVEGIYLATTLFSIHLIVSQMFTSDPCWEKGKGQTGWEVERGGFLGECLRQRESWTVMKWHNWVFISVIPPLFTCRHWAEISFFFFLVPLSL